MFSETPTEIQEPVYLDVSQPNRRRLIVLVDNKDSFDCYSAKLEQPGDDELGGTPYQLKRHHGEFCIETSFQLALGALRTPPNWRPGVVRVDSHGLKILNSWIRDRKENK